MLEVSARRGPRRLRDALLRVACLLSATALVPAVLLAAPSTAGAATSGRSLGGFSDMVYDSAHRHLFVSTGYHVLVLNKDGGLVTTVPGVTGTDGLALAPGYHKVFVALPGADAVAAIDTVTLRRTGTIPTGAGTAPQWLAMASGKLWISLTRGALGGVSMWDPRSPGGGVQAKHLAAVEPRTPLIGSAGGAHNVLALAPAGESEVTLYRVTGANNIALIHQQETPFNVERLVFGPGGGYFTAAGSGEPFLDRWRANDMADAGGYRHAGHTTAATYSPDGRWFVSAGDELTAYSAGSALPHWQVPLDGSALPNGVALSGDSTRAYVTTFKFDAHLNVHIWLHILPGPASAAAPAPMVLPGLDLDDPMWERISAVVYDPQHHHLFISPGGWGTELEVADESGRRVKLIPGMYGAAGMTLSPDGRRLYVALSTGDAVAVIDTSTLQQVGRIFTGVGSKPSGVAFAAGRLWVNHANGAAASYRLASIDPTQPGTGWTYTDVDSMGPLLSSAGPAGTHLVTGDPGTGPSPATVVHVTPTQATLTGAWQLDGFPAQIAAFPDDKTFLVSRLGVVSMSTVSNRGRYGKGAGTFAISSDGRYVLQSGPVGTGGVILYNAATRAVIATGGPGGPWGPSLIISPDSQSIFYLSHGPYSDTLRLVRLQGPAAGAAVLTPY